MSTKNTPKLTANQSVILDEIRKGAGTDAEIGETLSDMKLSAIANSVRGLVKRGIVAVVQETGRYHIVAADQSDETPAAPEADETPEAPVEDEGNRFGDVLGAAYSQAVTQNKPRLLTPSGSGAKMVTVSNTAYVTTDGKFATVKDRDDKKNPWSLYRIGSHAWEGDAETGHATAVIGFVGEFKTCTAAFADAKVLKGAQSA